MLLAAPSCWLRSRRLRPCTLCFLDHVQSAVWSLFAQSARRIVPQRMLDLRRGGCWHHGKRHGRTSSTSIVPLHCQGRLEAIPFIAKRPVSSWFSGCAARRHPNVKRQDRALCAKKDQAAHGKWPRKYSVHGIVAQKRRAGVLATASARASPRVHARRETKPQLRAGKVVYVSHF